VDHATHEPLCNPELGWGMMQAGSRNDDGTSEAAKSMHGRVLFVGGDGGGGEG
jgi:hypothetical protein